jgi:GDP-4-dehydro-6-deoxy-D-mannose reductase
VLSVRAFITGGSGFVGTWLAEHLRAQGDEVVAVDLEVDVADPSAITPALAAAAPDAVYHLAALTHVGASWESPSAVLSVNVLGTACVLAAARALARPPVVLVVSSAEVYGVVAPGELPLTESSPVAPVSPYAASKAAAEQVALQAWRGFGQPVIVVRPFNHIGPGQSPTFAVPALASRIAQAQRDGTETLSVGTLSTRRDFTDVRDVVRAYRRLVEAGEPGTTYNVCSGVDVSMEEIAAALLRLAGADLALVTDPALVRPVDVPALRGDPARLAAATGWRSEIALETTLADVLAYWRNRVD